MTTEPLSPEEQVKDQVLAPTVTIYQHGEHVAGVVQQFFERPLVVDETFENEGTSSTGQKSEHNAGVQVAGEANTPLIAKVKAQADYSYLRGHEGASATSTRAVQNFVYSQAYYLNLVRKALRDAEVLRTVANLDDARHLKAGDFVEYRAWFRPSEVTTLMDVVTPELVETITRTQHKLSEAKLFEGYGRTYRRRPSESTLRPGREENWPGRSHGPSRPTSAARRHGSTTARSPLATRRSLRSPSVTPDISRSMMRIASWMASSPS